MSYNYEHFDAYVESGAEAREFAAFPNLLHAGGSAPDATLIRLDDGQPERLSERWRRRPLVIEFGSFT